MDGQLYTDETEESFCVWRTFFSEKTNICTYQVDLFRLRATVHGIGTMRSTGSGRGARQELTAFLTDAGFEAVKITAT